MGCVIDVPYCRGTCANCKLAKVEAERDQLRDVIRRARPFILWRLSPAAERMEGVSELRGEVDRLCREWGVDVLLKTSKSVVESEPNNDTI